MTDVEQLKDIIQKNKVNYDYIFRVSEKNIAKHESNYVYDVLVIIGVRKRNDFLPLCVESIKKAVTPKYKVSVIVVEHSEEKEHYDYCQINSIDYIHIKCKEKDQYNRSLAFNVGYLAGAKSKWVMTHDVDCLVQYNFFDRVFANIDNKRVHALQTYNDGHVCYLYPNTTIKILNNSLDVNKLEGTDDQYSYTVKGKSSGGSIIIKSELYERVGMYDPELFTGYAPEDQFIWHKILLFTEIGTCNNPVNNIYHLHHEPTMSSNPQHEWMELRFNMFNALNDVDKMDIINYKRGIYGK